MIQRSGTVKVVVLTVVLLLAVLFVAVQFGGLRRTILVPIDYLTISEAVANAYPGDSIHVKSGVYYENLIVNKSLSIAGEDRESTIVIGTGGVERGMQTVFTLAANDVLISGFAITSLNYSNPSQHATGISVEGDNCNITGNNLTNLYYGVFCSVQSSIIISNNNINDNFKDGIRFCGGSQNYIINNNITGNTQSGIAIEGYSNIISKNTIENNNRAIGVGSSYSVIFGNSLADNKESGLYFAGSNNIICGNDISRNKWGVYFTPFFAAPNANRFYHNNFIGNTGDIGMISPYDVNFWDNGSQGNYWGDYTGVDANRDNICDIPYVVDNNNMDKYPMITPFNIQMLHEPPTSNQLLVKNQNGLAAHWSFDEIKPNNLTPDTIGNTPAIVGSTSGDISYTPQMAEGKVGKALSFDGAAYVNARILPTLEIRGEATINVWINMQSFKEVEYSNIVVECIRTRTTLPERTFGLAVNGAPPPNNFASIPQGALRAYVSTESEGLNEIVTIEPVVSLNEWNHIVFTRSLTSGMRLYVNGEEKTVTVNSGVQNPQGPIRRPTELYIGHDAVCLIDEVRISNMISASFDQQPLWIQWWFWTTIFAVSLVIGLLFYFKSGTIKGTRFLQTHHHSL